MSGAVGLAFRVEGPGAAVAVAEEEDLVHGHGWGLVGGWVDGRMDGWIRGSLFLGKKGDMQGVEAGRWDYDQLDCSVPNGLGDGLAIA